MLKLIIYDNEIFAIFLEGIVFPRSEKSIFGPKKSGEIMNLADLLTNTALNDNDPLSTIWTIENTNEKPETEVSLSSQDQLKILQLQNPQWK